MTRLTNANMRKCAAILGSDRNSSRIEEEARRRLCTHAGLCISRASLARVRNFVHNVPPTRVISGRFLVVCANRTSRIAGWRRLALSRSARRLFARWGIAGDEWTSGLFRSRGRLRIVIASELDNSHSSPIEKERWSAEHMECRLPHYEYDHLIKPILIVSKLMAVWPLKDDRPFIVTLFKTCHLSCLFFIVRKINAESIMKRMT
jgi:hypothetical protein